MITTAILVKAGQLILSLSILVVLHELGHFIPAKLFKTKVEKFYLFFDPWFSLFKFKKGETEYGIGWLPLGGYVKISGMIDESMDKEQMSKPPEPWEFRSKPAWQRLIIMIGGVTVNIVLAFFIYTMILWYWGETYLPTKNLTYGIATDSLTQSIGLRDGDMILSVDGHKVDNFHEVAKVMVLKEAKSIQVEREGQQVNIPIPEMFISKVIERRSEFIGVRVPSVIDSVGPESKHAIAAGLQKNDKVLTVNGAPADYLHLMGRELMKAKGKTVNLTILRGSDTLTKSVSIPAEGDYAGKLGVSIRSGKDVFKFVTTDYSFAQAVPAGFSTAVEKLKDYVQQLRLIFVSKEVKVTESLGGFGAIGNLFPSVWDWQSFWSLTALLSVILAFMNILPIPALDGGHVLFLIYEIITGRKPGDKFMEYAQIVGMVILFSLLLFANGLDLWRAIRGWF
ncbi:RIP metalloprotease RseP [Chitinophaga horti]|uniref:Zinc metalloprotease n=1 Tax=Chitinophaga horti TaxID=2920382 RepID=A0ABY6IZJ7_9BACT|nr:RIP metalloprotease RseP [Chitinophaga horti]UYQ91419.1 RIP metalloprotease RseP [Chitinophaga horti]